MSGAEIDAPHEHFVDDYSMVNVVRSDSLMNFDNHGFANQTNEIQIILETTTSAISCKEIINEFTLNDEQTRAFMIISSHLDGKSFLKKSKSKESCSFHDPYSYSFADDVQEQLIMCVPSAGDTGKSQLISAFTRYFAMTKQSHKLRKLAPTVIAATNIDGMTIHSFLKDSRKVPKKRISKPGDSSIENEWRHIQYILIDEISMVGLRLLARLHEILTIAKRSDPSISFGSLNIVFFGDFMQYAPVLDKA